jgi:hypothetical protein
MRYKTPSLKSSNPLIENRADLVLGGAALSYPHHAIFGATDPFELLAFLSLFGYQPKRMEPLSADAAAKLYGLSSATEQWIVQSPGLDSPVRVVRTPHAPDATAPMQLGPYGIDVYSSDLRLTLDVVAAAGFAVTDIVPYEVEGWPRLEARAIGPDGFTVFLIESLDHRFPSVLDSQYWRTHSQIHMLCWVVDNIDSERNFWTKEAGLEIVRDVLLDPQAMVDLMAHPEPVPFGAVQVADRTIRRRMELMHFPETRVPRRSDWPLRSGFHGGAFRVGNLDVVRSRLSSASISEAVPVEMEGDAYVACTAVSPGGVRFELWQPA